MPARIPARHPILRGETVKGWIQLSRPPFHLVGLLPFILGTVMAWRLYGIFNVPVLIWSILAVVLTMLSTYYSGEYHDLAVDTLSAGMERNAFSGGSQVIVRNLLPHRQARYAGYVMLLLAGVVGVVLQFYYDTGLWTIPLGVTGMIAGFFYSTPPLRWVKRGVGELIIGYCYGWLPVATAFYLQVGRIDDIVHWVAIPIACTIFNVILINEFPDYPADLIEGKRNLVVRLGKSTSAYLYIAMHVTAWIAFGLSVNQGVPGVAILLYLPVFFVSLMLVVLVWRCGYLDRKRLALICGLTIFVNLGTSLSYTIAVWLESV